MQPKFRVTCGGIIISRETGEEVARVAVESLTPRDALDVSETILAALEVRYSGMRGENGPPN